MFAGKRLVALTLMTAIQILPPEFALAYPQSSDSTRSTQRATAAAIEILTHTEGVDFRPFMQSVYRSVKREWISDRVRRPYNRTMPGRHCAPTIGSASCPVG